MAVKQPPEIPLPPKPGKPGGLGEKLETSLVRFAGRILNSARETLSGMIRYALDTFMEGIEPFIIRATGPLLRKLRDAPGSPPEIKSLIDAALSGESQAAVPLLAMLGSAAAGGVIGSLVQSLTAPLTYQLNTWMRLARPDLPTLQALRRRGKLSEADYGQYVGDLGWNAKLEGSIWDLNRPRSDVITLAMDAWRRGRDFDSIIPELERRGYASDDILALKTAMKPIPGAGDLIHMAVREAWNDSVAAFYGYDQDRPGEFVSWMKKQGFDEEWAYRWWRAHWEIPGPTMGMEMLHRTSMTENDYKTLLKIADYPAKFRDWMTEVAYSPYTRVDIRRMYQVGVLKSYAELVRAYKDIGYKEDKAKKLADFTVLEYGETEREATRTEVVSAYQIGRLSLAESKGYLNEMGYPGWVVEMYLARADMARTVSMAKEQISHVKTMYVNSQMTRTDVYSQLGKIPLPAAEIERYLAEWEISRTAKIARPSRTDLLRFFLQNEMSEAEFRAELAGYRLSARYVDWYVADAKRKLSLAAQEELERADEEARKVRAAVEKTAYDIKAADIAVEIASLNLLIADLKAGATPEMSLEEFTELGDLIVQAQLAIKALQLQKAHVWSAYLKEKGV